MASKKGVFLSLQHQKNPSARMGLKDMFRSSGKSRIGSPKDTPKGSRAGSPPKEARRSSLDQGTAPHDDLSVSSRASSHRSARDDARQSQDMQVSGWCWCACLRVFICSHQGLNFL